MEKTKSKQAKYEPKKCIIQPKDNKTMLNSNGEAIHHNRPTLVTFTQFVEQKLAEGTVDIFAKQLPSKATDNEFKEYIIGSKGDIPLAISAYCSSLGVDTEGKAVEQDA